MNTIDAQISETVVTLTVEYGNHTYEYSAKREKEGECWVARCHVTGAKAGALLRKFSNLYDPREMLSRLEVEAQRCANRDRYYGGVGL